MNSIGFNYNGKHYICQSEGPGVWECGESLTPANIQLTCSNDGLDKISCTLPESTTNLICETSISSFNCTIKNDGKGYLEKQGNNGKNNSEFRIVVIISVIMYFFFLLVILTNFITLTFIICLLLSILISIVIFLSLN